MTPRGFSLIEVLVALAVLSVGLLGVAALLLTGLRHQGDAVRAESVTRWLADAAERLRLRPGDGADEFAELSASARQLWPDAAAVVEITRLPGAPGDESTDESATDSAAYPDGLVGYRIQLRWDDAESGRQEAVTTLLLPAPPPDPA